VAAHGQPPISEPHIAPSEALRLTDPKARVDEQRKEWPPSRRDCGLERTDLVGREPPRRPLRTYRTIRREEFALDGEVDAETIILPLSDGYPQVRLELTRQNPANATILSAARTLRPELREPMLVRQLQLIEGWLSPQGTTPHRQPRVPGRARQRRPLVDLSWDILRGASRELARRADRQLFRPEAGIRRDRGDGTLGLPGRRLGGRAHLPRSWLW
jgi:hypothetical protein